MAAALLVAACASSPHGDGASGSTPPTPGTAAVPAPPAAYSAAAEQRRLADALHGTPVIVDSPTSGQLRVQVPLEFSFDAGRSAVKPPLAAVLDRVATGMRQPGQFDIRINAPSDPRAGNGAAATALAKDRAAGARDYLIGKGVPLSRFAALAVATSSAVELVVTEKNPR